MITQDILKNKAPVFLMGILLHGMGMAKRKQVVDIGILEANLIKFI
tara:strand:+ start:339 stop:476 length:138 start_codon:yes stop_codon:yes gene_type:complete